jgi:hypothetical protein
MPQIIYKANSSGLIAQGDRSVTTYPSGLLKVEQTFIGLTENESTDRLQLQIGKRFPLDGSPSLDGVFIFPATQENRGADGFTTYKVSGYGRINEEGYAEFIPYIFSRSTTFITSENGSSIFTSFFRSKEKLTQRVIKNTQESEDPNGQDFVDIPLPIALQPSAEQQFYNPISSLQTIRKDVQRTNFGKFTELKTLASYG